MTDNIIHDSSETPLPEILPILPIDSFVLFPSIIAPIVVAEEKSKKLVDETLGGDRMVGIVTRSPEFDNSDTFEQLHSVGVAAKILKMIKMPDGTVRLLVHGLKRISIEAESTTPYLKARVKALEDVVEEDPEATALHKTVLNLIARAAELSHLPEDLVTAANNIEEAGRLADLVTSNMSLKVREQLMILDETNVSDRLRQLLIFLTREIEVMELGNQIQTRVKTEIDKNQREYYLREQMKAIRSELGDDDGSGTQQLEDLRKRLAEKELPDNVYEVAMREIKRLFGMQPSSAEYTVSRTYVDWLLDLPWLESSKDSLDIQEAEKILNEDHYDLEKVKQRILEYLSVLKLKDDMKGPILCLAGPPGVGKTSLGKSIARAVNREFYRLSLGGMRDEAEIRGHRRTYIGAMPGRIIKGLKHVGANNPVMMLDEIDKLASDYRGDPAAALLEVLDPEQNNTFTDNYLDLPFDLSRVLFITTANMLETIPGPLRDRMEVITLSGYTAQEKLMIAKKYLVPRQMKANGIERRHISFADSALLKIIEGYTREAGLRNLERAIGAVCRKVAYKVAAGKANKGVTRITPKLVETLLGPETYHSEVAQRMGIPGVAIGLAWTPVGGEILFIECSRTRGVGRFILTGQLGDVMRESAHAAMTYLRGVANRLHIPDEAFVKNDIHIHIPAGAIPKDGPSAGITLCVALASLLTGRPVKDYLALTGEISLKGNVLPIGGLKEKVLGAARAGIQEIILPKRNEADLEQLPPEIRKKIKFHAVDHIDQVLLLSLQPAKTRKKSATKPAAKSAAKKKATEKGTKKPATKPKATTPTKKAPVKKAPVDKKKPAAKPTAPKKKSAPAKKTVRGKTSR
ncbi:endopeptidase La [candidate division BRC1 bacterium HGW-BRC1-1]|nr:MAG: endopeptidase La [candidate division BRC1 bacterium HGW-BRC1-1]